MGRSTVKAIVGTKLFPGLGDRYLGRTGYKSQQTGEPVSADRPSNLFEPVAGLHATHGDFDDKATDSSPELWLSENRGRVAAATLAAAAAGVALLKWA